MNNEKQFNILTDVLGKGPKHIVQDYLDLLHVVESIIKASEVRLIEIENHLELSKTQLVSRRKNPHLWSPEELLRLFEFLKLQN